MMQTRCPHCGTTFRIATEQLKAKQGRVRCGKCQGVFDALAALASAEAAPAPEAVVRPEQAPPAEVALPSEPEHPTVPEHPAEPEAEPAPEAEELEPEPELEEPQPEAAAEVAKVPESAESEPEAKPETEPGVVGAPPVIAPEPLLHEDEPHPRGGRWPWILASLLAAIALVAQALLHFRTEVVLLAPETRPLFAAACDFLGCELALPHKIDLLGIEASDLAPDREKAGRLNLAATLRNRAPYAQAWPHLEITLTDAQDRALLRRALAPAEYLPAGQSVAAGFPGQSEQAVQLTLDVGDTPAVGYRLYIFHP